MATPGVEACQGIQSRVSVLAALSHSRQPLPGAGDEGRTWQPLWQAEFAVPAWMISCTPSAGAHPPWLPPNMPEHTAASRFRLSGLCFLLQILNILLFAVFVRYSPESSPGQCPPQLNCSRRNQDSGFQQPREYPHARECRRAVLLRGWHGGVTVLSSGCRPVTGSRVKQKGNIMLQGWGTGVSQGV